MGSTYIHNFVNHCKEDDEELYKNNVIEVINDLEDGKGLKHFLKLSVSDEKRHSGNRGYYKVDWKRRFCSSNYISLLLKEYQTYFKDLEIDGGYNTLNQKGKDVIDYFLEKINMGNLIKRIAKARKKCGDVYVYYYVSDNEENTDFGSLGLEQYTEQISFDPSNENKKYKILNFRILESNKVKIYPDADGNPLAYVYTDKRRSYSRNGVDLSIGGTVDLFSEDEIETKIIFMKGSVYVYKNEKIVDQRDLVEFGFEGRFPLLHMQFEKEDGKVYSNNPFEEIIDYHLEMDRIESMIKYINNLSGHSQLVVTDGAVDEEHSEFGPNSIVYVDTLEEEGSLTSEKKFQAKVQQLEIKNELQTLKDEKADKEEKIYKMANLPSIKTYNELLKTENSKVWENVRKSLEAEIRDFYKDFIFKTKDIFEVLLKVNGVKLPKKPVKFKMPEFIIEPSIFDVYTLKAQKMNMKELSIQKNLKELGLSEQEIKQELENWRIIEFLSQVDSTTSSTSTSGASNNSTPSSSSASSTIKTAGQELIKLSEQKGIDNKSVVS